MKALVCLSAPVFLETTAGPANVITQRPQIPIRLALAQYILGRLPAPAVLYDRNAPSSANDVMGTIRGWWWLGGCPVLFSRAGSTAGADEGILPMSPTTENANRRPKCNAKKDSSGVNCCDWPIAKSRARGKNMRAHDHPNRMADVAQVQEAVEPSLDSRDVGGGTEPEYAETSGSAEDLLDRWSSSMSADMRGGVDVQ